VHINTLFYYRVLILWKWPRSSQVKERAPSPTVEESLQHTLIARLGSPHNALHSLVATYLEIGWYKQSQPTATTLALPLGRRSMCLCCLSLQHSVVAVKVVSSPPKALWTVMYAMNNHDNGGCLDELLVTGSPQQPTCKALSCLGSHKAFGWR